jgi:hypothetical protein
MAFFPRAIQREVKLDGGIKVSYKFDFVNGAKVLPYHFKHLYRGERLEENWPFSTFGINHVRELYRRAEDTKTEVLIPGPEVRWQSRWAQWGALPPFTYDEFYHPRLAVERLGDRGTSKPALEIWHEKVEPKFRHDPSYYPEDWQWRRLWVYERDRRCCKCKEPLLSPTHYCPAKISEGHPNPLKISMITHGQSENDFN